MKTFTINLDYKRSAEDIKKISNSNITLDYLTYAVSQTFSNGLDGQKRRTWGRIQRKLDEAIDNNSETIELEEAEVYFLKTIFKDITFIPHLAKFVVILEDELEKLFD